ICEKIRGGGMSLPFTEAARSASDGVTPPRRWRHIIPSLALRAGALALRAGALALRAGALALRAGALALPHSCSDYATAPASSPPLFPLPQSAGVAGNALLPLFSLVLFRTLVEEGRKSRGSNRPGQDSIVRH